MVCVRFYVTLDSSAFFFFNSCMCVLEHCVRCGLAIIKCIMLYVVTAVCMFFETTQTTTATTDTEMATVCVRNTVRTRYNGAQVYCFIGRSYGLSHLIHKRNARSTIRNLYSISISCSVTFRLCWSFCLFSFKYETILTRV